MIIADKYGFFYILLEQFEGGSKKAKEKLTVLNEGLKFSEENDVNAIYNEITEKLHAMNEALCYHYICSSFSGAMNNALFQILHDSFSDKDGYGNFISALLYDIDGIESADILKSLRALSAEILRLDPNAAKMSESELLSFVTNKDNRAVYDLYCEFLRKHGHRSIKEAELRSKAWKNDPDALMKNLKTVLCSGEIVQNDVKPFDLEALLSDFKGMKKIALRFVGKNARQAVCDREFSKSNIIKVIDKFKDRYSLLAEKLTEAGLLADEDSIYFLSHGEIGMLIEGDSSLKRKAVSRRMVFRESEELSFEDINIGTPVPIDAIRGEAIQSLKGIPVSRGKVYGRARIVRSFEDALKIQKGEIMVSPFTDIGWSPYYSVISALVTEVGSALSHGAVVAREYCLPTIVNVKNATVLIKDGDCLCVDASAGIVHILNEEEFEGR